VSDGMGDGGQNLGDIFADIGRQLGEGLANLSLVAAGQGAMGWMIQGEPDRARQALADLTDEQRALVAEAAVCLLDMLRKDHP
jgi:hypothetical protein